MKALVLIGGLGTRLRPVTFTVPKQLIPIAGKPMLYHVLDLLPPEVDEAVLATGYKSAEIERYIHDHPPKVPVRLVPEAEPLGTGGGMRNAGDTMSDPFLLLNSDVIAAVRVPDLTAFHESSHAFGTMTLVEVDDTRPYGVAALGANDRIERFVEKPEPANAPSHWINAGVQVWSKAVLDRIPRGHPFSFESEILPPLLDRGIFGFRSNGFWEDAGTPERLLRAQKLLFDSGRGGRPTVPSSAFGKGPIAIGVASTISGASFGPYVTLGSQVTVEAGAHVENSVLMDQVVVGQGASVVGSILGPGVRVHHGRTVHGSVLGAGAEV